MLQRKLLAVDTDIIKFYDRYQIWKKHNIEIIRVNTIHDAISHLNKDIFIAVGINADCINFRSLLPLLKASTFLPIHVITSTPSYEEQVEAIKLGADVYSEWLPDGEKNVIRGLVMFDRFNKSHFNAKSPIRYISYSELVMYPDFHLTYIGDVSLDLRKKEFDILYMLAESTGRVFSLEQIYERVWKEPFYIDNNEAVYVQIRNLRNKLAEWPEIKDCIETIRDIGYRLRYQSDKIT